MRAWYALMYFCLVLSPTVFAQADAPPIYGGSDAYKLAPRNALVIGVSAVQDLSGFAELKNPRKDAEAVTKALRELDFKVRAPHEDYSPEQMTRQVIVRELYDFMQTLQSVGGVGLVYFSGHGLEQQGQLFLVPYDAFIRYDRDLNEELVPVSLFMEAFKRSSNNLNFLIVDACRNNPWEKPLEVFHPREGLERPLLEWETVVRANATLSGQKARDGDALSPYARAFVDNLKQPDTTLAEFFFGLSRQITREAQDEKPQVPIISFAGDRDFTFRPTQVSFNRELQLWNDAARSGIRSKYEELAMRYSGGYFYKAAQQIIKHGDFAPKPVRGEIIEVRNATVLRNSPMATASGSNIGAGEPLLVVVSTDQASDPRWLKVPADGKLATYIDRSSVKPTSVATTTIAVTLVDGSPPGTYSLTADARSKLKAAAAAALSRPVNQVEVVGHLLGNSTSPMQRMLVQRATVVEALSKAGLDASKIVTSSKLTDDESLRDSVVIIVKTSA